VRSGAALVAWMYGSIGGGILGRLPPSRSATVMIWIFGNVCPLTGHS
jgi:hypothetical protein